MGISGELWVEMVSDTNLLMSHIEISRLVEVNKNLFPLKFEVNIIYFEYMRKSILLISLIQVQLKYHIDLSLGFSPPSVEENSY
jgi:hypothetical protein